MTTLFPLSTRDALVLYGETFASYLLLGTSRYPSPQILKNAVALAKPGMITFSLRRQGKSTTEAHSSFWGLLKKWLQGLVLLRQYAQLMRHYPLVGIGGIDENTIQAVAKTGVGSVAVVRAITGSDTPEAVVKRLTRGMAKAITA